MQSNRNIVASNLLAAVAGLQVTASGSDKVGLSNGLAGGLILDVANTTAAPTTAAARVTAAAAGDPMMSFRVSGDTAVRFRVDTTAGGLSRLYFGPGNAGLDAVWYRAAAALFGADSIAFNNNGSAEVLQAFSFANSWAQTAGRLGSDYRRIVTPNEMEIMGAVTVPAGFAVGQAITNAAAAAYQPASIQSLTAWDTTTNLPVRLTWTTTGVLQFIGPVANTAAAHNLDIPVQRIHLTN
jgi:hypothetical protein